ncbi:MAG: hypothetical protein QGG42_18200 [Phycisphaerae bacterium]|jgi:hypothetical protein|nr:hypothetical protein [Phycisphaerae bacterium]
MASITEIPFADVGNRMENEDKSSDLKETHKDLYGTLMVVNQRIDNVGTMLFWILGIAALAVCVSIHMRWFDSIFGVSVEQLRGFGVYSLIMIGAFVVFAIATNYKENMIYSAAKSGILESLMRDSISVESLLADIADDKKLTRIKEKLMNDENIQRAGRTRL